jgi:hypothetical protein
VGAAPRQELVKKEVPVVAVRVQVTPEAPEPQDKETTVALVRHQVPVAAVVPVQSE